MAYDRSVAGIRCTEVLEDLSEYVDQQLPPQRVEQIHAHLRGCDWCERFGGDFSSAVTALRQQMESPVPAPDAVRSRLRERLRREIAGGA